MNRVEKLLKTQIKMGYWPGFTMAMYPNQFAYEAIHVDFEKIWKDCKEVNLYYHIPFCRFLCPYCGFFTIAQNDKEYMARYVDKINEQIETYAQYMDGTTVKSICFGGGTPNNIPVSLHEKIFEKLESLHFQFDEKLEPSMEVSPEIIDEDYIRDLKSIGIKRLSLGVQSVNLDLRKTINRDNNYDLLTLVEIMRKHDMNLNIDIMSGLAGQTEAIFMETVERLMEFKPETISIYPLAGNESSMVKHDSSTMSNKEKYELFSSYYDYLLDNGYYCESNVKFVKKGQTSTHQQKIYEYQGVDTMGIGCCARSYNTYTHYSIEQGFNQKGRKQLLDQWINSDFRDLQYYGIHIDEAERKSRFAIYGIFVGVLDTQLYKTKFGCDISEDFPDQIEAIKNLGMVEEQEGHNLVITKKGRIYTDLVCTLFWSSRVRERFENRRGNGE